MDISVAQYLISVIKDINVTTTRFLPMFNLSKITLAF